MKEEVDVIWLKECSVIESHLMAISLVTPLVIQISIMHGPKYFYLFLEDEEDVHKSGTQRGHNGKI